MPDSPFEATAQMRKLATRYIAGQLTFSAFVRSVNDLLGQFDPLDATIEGLPEQEKAVVIFFSEWMGGEFGESRDLIPVNVEWKYGDPGEYGWVDQKAFRERFAAAYGLLRTGPNNS